VDPFCAQHARRDSLIRSQGCPDTVSGVIDELKEMSINVPLSVAMVLSEADCSGAVSEEFISEVERQSGLVFPGEYRAFLSEYGAALLPGFEVHGLVPSTIEGQPPYWTDVRTLLSKLPVDGLSSHLVPISDDGATSSSIFHVPPGRT
jgi:hypothetical protein